MPKICSKLDSFWTPYKYEITYLITVLIGAGRRPRVTHRAPPILPIFLRLCSSLNADDFRWLGLKRKYHYESLNLNILTRVDYTYWSFITVLIQQMVVWSHHFTLLESQVNLIRSLAAADHCVQTLDMIWNTLLSHVNPYIKLHDSLIIDKTIASF